MRQALGLALVVALLAIASAAPSFQKDYFGGKKFTSQADARKAAKDVVDFPKEAWAAYKATFKLNNLAKEDDAKRFEIFKARANRVLELNSQPGLTWRASLNEYSYLSDDELSARSLGLVNKPADANVTERRLQETVHQPARKLLQTTSACQTTGISSFCDWRAAGKVTPVKNQGQCGSCWAFGAVAAMESAYLIKKNVNADMSEEQFVDKCVYSTGGCNGGWPSAAFSYAKSSAVYPESVYKYTAVAGSCETRTLSKKYSSTAYKATSTSKGAVLGYVEMTPNNYQNLISSVLQAPTVIAFRVVSDFYSYNSGVYTSTSCAGAVNHAMVAVGFDSAPADGSTPYFILKNSWGPTWAAEGGYIRVQMTKTNDAGLCGLYTYGARPTL